MTPAECQVRADTDLGTSKGWETKICGTGYDGGGRGFLASHLTQSLAERTVQNRWCVLLRSRMKRRED